MYSVNLKRSSVTIALIAGLAVAGPAGAGTQAHSPAPPELSAGGHPSQGAATVGGGTQTKPEAYRSPTPGFPG